MKTYPQQASEQIEYVYPRVLDWSQIMQDIIDSGCTCSRVALLLGVSKSTIHRWVQGSEPGHAKGNGVLMIHAKYAGQDLTRQRVSEGKI